jgi:hypothetical protein
MQFEVEALGWHVLLEDARAGRFRGGSPKSSDLARGADARANPLDLERDSRVGTRRA